MMSPYRLGPSPGWKALVLLIYAEISLSSVSSNLASAFVFFPRALTKQSNAKRFLASPVFFSHADGKLARFQATPPRLPLTKLHALFSTQASNDPTKEEYDLVIIGSGNGACGFLSRYLDDNAPADLKILVLEQGKNFFFTSAITHQDAWTKSYSEGNIFQLHNARTPDGTPILAGRACTMGGGGSINYTMIHESSKWLARHLGRDEKYWDDLKAKLNQRFHRPDPATIETPVTEHILQAGKATKYLDPNPQQMIAHIPSYDDNVPPANAAGQLYQFPTQFNEFGQRTNSGVSLIDWSDRRIHLLTEVKVSSLVFDNDSTGSKDPTTTTRCKGVTIAGNDNNNLIIQLSKDGRVIVCAGAASPRLLIPHRQRLGNVAIGQDVNDHFAMPLGLYVPDKTLNVSPKDIYAPVFATTVWDAKEQGFPDGVDTVCCFDFFTGRLEQLLYLTSHLFLAFLPNFVKSALLQQPTLFMITKNVVRTLVTALNLLITLVTDGRAEFITAIVKYNPAQSGEYSLDGSDHITLRWFESEQDKAVAQKVITDNLALMANLGSPPPTFVSWIYHTLTKIPFDQSQVDGYVEHYRKNSLLSEQHMAGGCLFGKVLDLGISDSSRTGQVKGTSNVHVADLSTVPLPRVSPQMTAYIIGFHVAHQLRAAAVAENK